MAAQAFGGGPQLSRLTSELVVVNRLPEAVNVYASTVGVGREVFVGQVEPGRTDTLAVRGIPAGSSARLRALPVSGAASLERDTVRLDAGARWQLP
ncbi:MAG TPA: hypothetical protein VEZ47_00690 [Gemmatirosa sp.]|jgi:hypothetical protein|nr:hypothetical protein [Gemmatirosa sp.]